MLVVNLQLHCHYNNAHLFIPVDPCDGHSCNTGTCYKAAEVAKCECSGTGFEGTTCSDDIDECDTQGVCFNSGTCRNIVGNFTCVCTDSYIGERCATRK